MAGKTESARWREWSQPLRYGAVGLVNTAIDWVGYALGIALLPGGGRLDQRGKFSGGSAEQLFFNARWTFREQFQASDRCAGRALGRFLVVSGVCLALNTATFALVFSGWQAGRWAALAAATAVTFVCGFWLNRVWTFR